MRTNAGLLVALVTVGGCRPSDAFRPLKVGQPAPRYAVRIIGADSGRVGPGEPVTLVNIWATWCIPCRKEFPELQALHEQYGGRGLRVLAVSIDRGRDGPVRDFVERVGATFAIGHDEAGEIQQVFQTVGVPETFLIGSNGKLLWRLIGALAPEGRDVRAAIEAALPAP